MYAKSIKPIEQIKLNSIKKSNISTEELLAREQALNVLTEMEEAEKELESQAQRRIVSQQLLNN